MSDRGVTMTAIVVSILAAVGIGAAGGYEIGIMRSDVLKPDSANVACEDHLGFTAMDVTIESHWKNGKWRLVMYPTDKNKRLEP